MTLSFPSAIAAMVLLSSAASTAVGAAPVELVESSEGGLTLRYEPGAADVRTESAGELAYVAVGVPGASPMGIEGAPELPVMTVRVAVPYCESIELSVTTGDSKTFPDARVMPSPTTVGGDRSDVSGTEYLEGTVYGTSGLWPPTAARLYEPSRLGTQRVAVVDIYPCQTDPVSGTLVTHGLIEVRLTFSGRADTEPARGERERRETLLESILLNFEEGKRWRARPVPTTGRPDGDYFTTSANWLRLTVREQGVHSVRYSDFLAAAVDPSLIDPSTFRVMNGGGLPVPQAVTDPRPEWMEECTIRVDDGEDGSFDQGDAVVFYALATDGWADELEVDASAGPYYENPFANDSVYWLTWETVGTPLGFSDDPLRMETEEPSSSSTPTEVDDYRERAHFEGNVYEFQGRGDNWFWFEMKRTDAEERFFHQQLDHVVTDSTGLLRGYVRGNSSSAQVYPDHHAVFYFNTEEAYVGEWDAYTTLLFEADGLSVNEGYNTYKVYAPRTNPLVAEDRILIDWFEIEYWRELWADTDQLRFGSSGRTGAVEFSIGGFADTDVTVFKITDKYTLSVVSAAAAEGDRVVFQDDVSDTVSYVAVSASGYMTPALVERVTPGELRTPTGADYIMITHDAFYDDAARLAALRESGEGGDFQVQLVRVSEVYDEFSWGLTDPAAIRDFLKFTYDNEVVPPTHGLLIGDATSDYRQYLPSSGQTFIPTAYTGGGSYWPTEQWFVGFTGTSYYQPALAFGRLPVRSASELRDVVDKIELYETESVPGPWKNTVVIVGDDQFKTWGTGNIEDWDCCEFFHTVQAESLHKKILPWPFDRKKIYLMEYEHDLAGHMPLARADVIQAWNDGALIFNYTGHGNEQLMAHEYIFLFDDAARLTNEDALPLYFASSCRLNKFDMQTTDSLGEVFMKSRGGGSIASIGSTRDSGATQNSVFNSWFYWYMFGQQRELTAPVLDLGGALQAAFMEGTNWYNNTKFCILGDPAIKLAAPEGSGRFSTDGLEPLRRRDTIALEGENEGASAGETGVALVRVTDSADTSGHLHAYPGPQKLVHYTLPGEPIFEGSVAVSGGDLGASFVVSALAEEGPHGRIRSYFYGSNVDGAYSVEGVSISDSVDVQDVTVPLIELEFDGGGTSILPGTGLSLALSDESGINLVDRTGADGIVLTIDGGAWTEYLTDEFTYDLNSHERGTIEFELPSLSNGGHTLSVAASDNMGNRATESLAFEIVSATEFSIRDVANYPNPFPDGGGGGTHILFQLPTQADITIQVFTVGGRLIRVIDNVPGEAGANQIYWDGLDQEGDEPANGVYLYRIHAVSKAYRGDKAETIGRAVIMR